MQFYNDCAALGVPANWGEYPDTVIQGYLAILAEAPQAEQERAEMNAVMKKAVEDQLGELLPR